MSCNKILLKFTHLQQLRLLLRHRGFSGYTHSSIYQLGSCYYILISISKNVKQELVVVNVPQQLSVDIVSAPDEAESVLLRWAESEINQSTDYIKFESISHLATDKRIIKHKNKQIFRTFKSFAEIFAVLNYTDDSFSDGGKFNTIDKAIKQITYYHEHGAQIIDLGVESTRPGAITLTDENEMASLKTILPHVLELKQRLNFKLSIDTYHAKTVKYLLSLDVDIINDVSASLPLELVREIFSSGRKYLAMHNLGIPSDKNNLLPLSLNPLSYMVKWMQAKIQILGDLGCDINNLILDPGIGFGLTKEQSWYLLRNINCFSVIPCELLIGHSRKSFFSHLNSKMPEERDMDTAIVAALVCSRVDYLRLHCPELFNQVNTIFAQFRV